MFSCPETLGTRSFEAQEAVLPYPEGGPVPSAAITRWGCDVGGSNAGPLISCISQAVQNKDVRRRSYRVAV